MEDKKNDISSMEYSKFFEARDLIDGVLRANRVSIKDETISSSKKAIGSETHEKRSGHLVKVNGDVGDILGKWNYFTKVFSKPSKDPISKIAKNKYFTGHTLHERNILKKLSPTRLPSRELSRSSIKIKNKKKSCKIIPRPSSPNNVNPNQILRKGPVIKSKLQNFKNKIVLSAETVVESTEKSIIQEEKKGAIPNIQNVVTFKRNMYNVISPVSNIGGFLAQSLHSVDSRDVSALKKTVETKIKNPSSESDSKINWLVKSHTIPRKKILKKEKDNSENRYKKIQKFVTIDNSIESNSNSSMNDSQRTERENDYISDRYENDSIESKRLVTLRHIVQSLKDSFNVNPNLHLPNLLQRESPTKNFIPNRDSALSKSTSNINSKSKKMIPKNDVNMKESKKSMNYIQYKDDNFQHNESDKKIKQMKSKNKSRSNCTLQNINIRADNKWNMKNNATSSMREQPVVKKSSTTSSKKSGVRRGCSLIENITEMLTEPERTLSSITTKLLDENFYSGRRVSSHSSFYGTSRMMKSNSFRIDTIKELRAEVFKAIKNRKTFTICGEYPTVRKSLQRRGWVEQYDITNIEKLEQQIIDFSYRSVSEPKNIRREKNLNDICKRLVQSKLLADHQVDLYWVDNTLEINFDNIKLTKINKLENDIFSHTDGYGLSDTIKKADWFNFSGMAHIKHPRTYGLTSDEETMDFIKDFRLTAAMSLLKWVIRSHKKGNCQIVSSSGNIPLEAFQFATNECFKKVIEVNNPDWNQPILEANDDEWNKFLEYYYNIIHIGHHFETSSLETETSMIEKSTYVIERLAPLYPNIEMDGLLNIWILKPTKGTQKKGIHICRTLQYIMKTLQNTDDIRYIVQKYIERPLLILNTKFDIRQWFLISSTIPLTVWMYKEYYLRFSSQSHNLRKLHESISAGNHSVSKQYQNTSHDITLPNYNMWDSQQFRNYLTNNGSFEVYSEVTYKGMKECIIWAVLIHQDKINKRKNSFELFEADFMLTEDFQPWLIEIYPNPSLKSTNPVTSRMCSRVLEDTIKVVVDRAENPKAGTGNFELIYKQSIIPSRSEFKLKVFGNPLSDDYSNSDRSSRSKSREQIRENLFETKSDIHEKDWTKTLESLLKFIQNERKRRRDKNLITEGTDPIKTFDTSVEDRQKSLMNLKLELDKLVGYGDISMAEEDRKIIDHTLKMLRYRNNSEVVKYLIEIINNILNRSIQNKK